MNEQTPAPQTGPALAPPELGDAVLLPTTVPLADRIRAVRNTLSWALREEGSRLWQARWLDQTCGPRLARFAEETSGEVSRLLERARERLAGVDPLPWTERHEPVSECLAILEEALDRCEPATARFRARALLVTGSAARPSAREPAPAPPVEEKAPPPPRPPRPQLPSVPLGHPEHTGRTLSQLPDVDEALVEALDGQGIRTLADLLQRLPPSCEVLDVLEVDADWPVDGLQAAITGTVIARWHVLRPGARGAALALRVGERTVRCRWPEGPPAAITRLSVGDEATLAGRLVPGEGSAELERGLPWKTDKKGRVRRPHYGLEGVDDVELRELVRRVIDESLPRLLDPVPREALLTSRVLGLGEAFRDIHLPIDDRGRGRARLVFEEFFQYRLALSARRTVRPKGLSHAISHELLGQLCVQHGIELDDEQVRAFDDVRRDLRRPVAMVRLLQGDVGSGKALVALMAAVVVAEGRSQVLFLAPDALAAEHRYMFAEPLLRSIGLVPHLLGKEPSKAQLDALRRGEAHLVFASHELLRGEGGLPEFKRLGLVVAEEREAFGTVSVEDLAQKKHHADLLVVTSVPIPTSLSFTLFSNFDLTVLRPTAERRVTTTVVQPDAREDAFAAARAALERGRQAYLVFPLSRGTDVVDRARGANLAAALAKEAFGGARVALYHGAMGREERMRVFEDFRHRRIDVLLSTTSIEDGPEVDNATFMMVENADRFDLVRLHRLRGHVSRGQYAGECFLVLSKEPDSVGVGVVELVAGEEDGFAIAEQDRLARGDEALIGERIADLPTFRWADPVADRELLIRARRAAFAILVKDPELRQRSHRELVRAVPGLPDPPAGGEGGRRRRRRRRRGSRR